MVKGSSPTTYWRKILPKTFIEDFRWNISMARSICRHVSKTAFLARKNTQKANNDLLHVCQKVVAPDPAICDTYSFVVTSGIVFRALNHVTEWLLHAVLCEHPSSLTKSKKAARNKERGI